MYEYHAFMLFLSVAILLYFIYTFYDNPIQRVSNPFHRHGDSYEIPKYILAWTDYFGEKMINENGWLAGCPQLNCIMTTKRSMLNDSDAVIFHIRNLNWWDIPPHRKISQYYVFYLLESPVHTYSLHDPALSAGFFNLTVTYRLDSDFVETYGDFRKGDFSKEYESDDLETLITNKDRLVAWFSSNCGAPSKRDFYAEELSKSIPVDHYGRCGTRLCSTQCNNILKERYKFYLSFENSLCKDYLTEKYYDRLAHYVVPVVLDKSFYSEKLAPNSLISATDFDSPKALADYLRYLDKNVTAYLEYFEWRKRYRVMSKIKDCAEPTKCGLCALCSFLRSSNNSQRIKFDAKSWWHDGQCDSQVVDRLLNRTI